MWRIRKRPRKGPLPFQYVFVISFLIFVLLTAQALVLVDKGLEPTLMEIAKNETNKVAQLAIQSAVKKRIVDSEVMDGLVERNGLQISTNNQVANEISSLATANVQWYLEQVEKGIIPDYAEFADVDVQRGNQQGIITNIPIGRATNNTLLASLGPKIPVSLRLTGAVQTDVKYSMEESGINNTLFKAWIYVKVSVQTVVPFQTDEVVIKQNIPLITEFISGDVPYYYNNGGQGGMQPAIPIMPDKKEKKEKENTSENNNAQEGNNTRRSND